MQSWTAPRVPRLPPQSPPTPSSPTPSSTRWSPALAAELALYDSARNGVHITGGPAGRPRTMYVCGITPYDATHLGHAATMIAFDLVHRVWRDAGHDVLYVQNVTDIDDPLLERANRDGEDWLVLAMRETALFREDMEALRILPPVHYVGAVESIPSIVSRVSELVARGAAYRIDDGTRDVYFDLSSAPRFGYESGLDHAEMLVLSHARGGDPDRPGKRDPLDPLLWRTARDGEPAWSGAGLGSGRPGWHIECAAIALDYLGWPDQSTGECIIDVQGGGNDLLFPHHECSAAHAEVVTGVHPFARHYVHAGMIGLGGEKMSKSKGNLVFVSRLRGDGVDPMAMRLALMSDHYRLDRQWTDDALKAAQLRLGIWREAVAAARAPSGHDVLVRLRAALADDLDTPTALDVVDMWSAATLDGVGTDQDAPSLVRAAVDALLGISLFTGARQ